ncbi:hypothetical protein JCM8208_007365 [Rhodotorula glutinis]
MAVTPARATRSSPRKLSATSPTSPAADDSPLSSADEQYSAPSPTRKAKVKAKKEESPAAASPTKSTGITPLSASALKKQSLYTAAREAGTPFPQWVRPTPVEAQEVCDLLGSVHGVPERPKVLVDREDAPAGCGQVPSVLDALVRTILSQNTSSRNSTAAKQSMDQAYGRAGYRAVLDGGEAKLEEAIRCGGLAKNKSKAIMGVLKRAEERNVHDQGLKPGEGELSLDWLHELDDDAAMRELVSFDLVGPKTASCVLLFCLGRDSFAVDTHVHRITQSLGWLPPNGSVYKLEKGDDKPTRVTTTKQPPTRDQTFYHLDHRLPNHLKYALHCLIVSHGRGCDRCAAGSTSQDFVDTCPIDHLVRRTKGRATGRSSLPSSPVKGAGKEPLEDAAEKELKPAVSSDEEDDDDDGESDDDFKPSTSTPRKTPAKRGRAKAAAPAADAVKEEDVDDEPKVTPSKRVKRSASAGSDDDQKLSTRTPSSRKKHAPASASSATKKSKRAQAAEESVARDAAEMGGRKYTMHGLEL